VLEKCQLKTADFKKWKSPVLFLSPATNPHGDGRLNPRVIKTVFKEVCILAGVEGHPPHAARHAMGRHLIEKTGDVAAVQRQLSHTNAAYSNQDARVTDRILSFFKRVLFIFKI
jgi:site-specific recombinase XerD